MYGEASTKKLGSVVMWEVWFHRFEEKLILPAFGAHRKIWKTNRIGIKK